jgi:activator of HSP90 ATPase
VSQSTKPAPSVSTRNRRRAVALIAAGLFAGARTPAETQPASGKLASSTTFNSKRTSLHQEINFKASPQRIYEALLSSKDFASFSGAPAEIDSKAGGTFSLFGGLVVGRNVELVPNRRIVQAWRAVDDWPEGVYTLVKFNLKPRGSETILALDHTGFAEGDFDHLNAGWYSHYWEPLKRFLA